MIATEGARGCRGALERAAGEAVVVEERFDVGDADDEERIVGALAGAWAVVAGSERYSEAVLGRLPELRAIVRFGAGTDAVDVAAATRARVAVVNTPGANAAAVADLAVALLLACVRRLPRLERTVRSGRWRRPELTGDLTGATVGIVGLGAIGRAVARRLQGFDCRLIAVEPAPDHAFCARHGIELAALHDALPQLAALTLHTALTPATHHLIGRRELALLPAHAIVVNTARGPLIDEPALVDALRAGAIAGAGLDVFETEPLPARHPLLALDTTIVTGHAASFTRLATSSTRSAVVEHVVELLGGQTPAACLNPEAWRDAR